ncbi:MAG: hypothetical protein WD009_01240 [Phycisphaeraceae bacterium]
MPCLLSLIAVFFPRVVIVLVFLFSSFLGDAYDTVLWPVLGFFFMPFTTLGYAVAVNYGGGLAGGWIILVVITVLMDLGQLAGARRQ